LNADAAALLGVERGSQVLLYGLSQDVDMRVAAVTRSGDVAGAQATVLLPIDRVQQLAERLGQINQILVTNRGSAR
jgi:hypothetical protein